MMVVEPAKLLQKKELIEKELARMKDAISDPTLFLALSFVISLAHQVLYPTLCFFPTRRQETMTDRLLDDETTRTGEDGAERRLETTDDWLLKPTQISQEKLPVEICNVGLSPVILSLQPYDTNNRLSSSLMGEMRSGDRRLVSQGWVFLWRQNAGI
jgi:hypothetical protein